MDGDTQTQDRGGAGVTRNQGDESGERGRDHQSSAYSIQGAKHGVRLRRLTEKSCQSLP
jgi:hypothetical protein